jgi:hypothetical protein
VKAPLAAQPAPEEMVGLRNDTTHIVNAGQIQFAPSGSQGDTIMIAKSKISEGLRRLIGNGITQL